jgi:MFS family permease
MDLRPLQLPPVRRLVAAYGINQLGDWAGEIAIAVAVLGATGNAGLVALTWVVHRCLPGLLTPAISARLEGRRPGRLLPALYLVQAAAFVGIVAGYPTGGLPLLLSLVALDGVIAPVSRATVRTALVGATEPAGLLREGNAIVNVVFTANAVLAPAVGGGLVAAFGWQVALLLNVASFVAAAATAGGLGVPAAAPEAPAGRGALGPLLAHAPVARLLVGAAAFDLFVAAINPVESGFVIQTLGGSEGELGAVLAAWGVGMVLTGAVGARLTKGGLLGALVVSSALQALAILGMGLAGSIAPVMIWSFVGGTGNGIHGLVLMTVLQERTPMALQARLNSAWEAVGALAPGLGFALGGIVAATGSVRAVYLIAGIGGLAVVAVAGVAERYAGARPSSSPASALSPA